MREFILIQYFLGFFRYDCRGHLLDLTLWDSDLIRKKSNVEQENFFTEEEKRIEEECDQERYVDLHRDLEKEALQQGEKSKELTDEFSSMNLSLEEELKRNNAHKNAYNQVGFSYDNSKESSTKTTEGNFHFRTVIFIHSRAFLETSQALDDDEYEPFYPSEKLQIPYGMDIVCSLFSFAVRLDDFFFV